jgi:formate dehydrogenase assembly factor FdhD
MREITKLDEAKLIGEFLLEIAKETHETITAATEERERFAIGFLKYVEETYTKQGDQYYFKNHNQHVHRNIIEVMENYKYFLKQHEENTTTTS